MASGDTVLSLTGQHVTAHEVGLENYTSGSTGYLNESTVLGHTPGTTGNSGTAVTVLRREGTGDTSGWVVPAYQFDPTKTYTITITED